MIIVNARFLTQPITGVQRFAIEISRLLKLRFQGDIRFITCPGIIHQKIAKELDAEVVGVNKSHVWEQVDLYLYLLRNGSPLLLSLGFTGPLLYKNQIVSIHDVAFKLYKDTFSKSFSSVYNFVVPRVAKRCLHIITVSHSAKHELVKEFDLPESKIQVVYNGISSVFRKNKKVIFKKPAKPYILTVSSHHPRKNYKRLIQAFEHLKVKDVDLYVIGNFINHFAHKKDYQENSNVKFLTNVSDEELLGYYQNAELFVFPSLYEGFGIPVIEAMSQHLRCVISDIPVFREIGDESVIYIDPLNVQSITDGIKKGLLNPTKTQHYPKLEKFNWENSAESVSNLLNNYLK